MAYSSLSPCSQPFCGELVKKGYCSKHKKKEIRKSAHQRGYSQKWKKARLVFLKLNPFCVYCNKDNLVRSATVVDHVIPHKGNMKLFWDKNNWQPLCKRHHDIKTATYDR